MLEGEAGQRRELVECLEAVGAFVAKQGSRGCMLSEALVQSSQFDLALRRQARRIRSDLLWKLKGLSGGDEALASFALGSALGSHAIARSGALKKQILAASSLAAKAIVQRR